jgi:hypothetical protein
MTLQAELQRDVPNPVPVAIERELYKDVGLKRPAAGAVFWLRNFLTLDAEKFSQRVAKRTRQQQFVDRMFQFSLLPDEYMKLD